MARPESPPSALLERHRDALEQATALLLMDPLGALPWHGAPQQTVQRLSLTCSADSGWQFGLEPAPAPADLAVMVFPKEKALAQLLAQYALAHLRDDGELWVVGENASGVRSTPKLMASLGAEAVKEDSAKHCQLYRVAVPSPAPTFSLDQWITPVSAATPAGELTLHSLPGVFSHGEVDAGTALLLDQLDGLRGQRVLDYGCGSGIFGATLARLLPEAAVTLSDNHWLALTSAERTLAAAGLDNAKVQASDGWTALGGRFDVIVSNPPFHRGRAHHYDAAEALLRDARQHLNPGGRLRFVANVALPYLKHLGDWHPQHRVLAETGHFRVYEIAV